MKAPVLVVGLGHPLMSDDGVGVRVAERLQQWPGRPAGIDVEPLGTGGVRVLHAIARRRKVVIVDGARMGETPGTWRRFTPEAVRSGRVPRRVSVHEADWLELLAWSRAMGECPEDVVVFGIEPACVEPGEHLSAAVAACVDEVVKAICEEVKGPEDHGVEND